MMLGDFQWQSDLIALCKYVRGKIWFNYSSSAPHGVVDIVEKYSDYGKYSNFKKRSIIKEIIKSVCEYLKLNYNYINLKLKQYTARFNGCFGTFRANSEVGADILITYSSQFSIYRQTAIIVHELTHYFAYVNDINFEIEEEICTDILSIFLGFYSIMHQGCAVETYVGDEMFGEKREMAAGYLCGLELEYCKMMISAMQYVKM